MDWSRTVRSGAVVAMLLMVGLSSIVSFGLLHEEPYRDQFLMFAATLLLAFLVFYLTRGTWEGTWRSIWVRVLRPVDLVVDRLDTVLTEEGMTFSRRGPREGPTGWTRPPNWYEVFDIEGLTIHLDGNDSGVVVYLGPVGRDNRDDVERLKGLVDRAVAPLERRVERVRWKIAVAAAGIVTIFAGLVVEVYTDLGFGRVLVGAGMLVAIVAPILVSMDDRRGG